MDTGVLSRAHWSKLSLPHQETTCEEKSTKRLLLTLNGRLFAQRHQFGDVTFFCAGETGCETAHSEVLALRSGDFLQALLRWAQADAQAGTRRAVSLSSFTRPVLTALLQYFYTGAGHHSSARHCWVSARRDSFELNASLSSPLPAGSVSFEGPQDALDVLFAAHFALLDECCELTVNWLRANMAASETPDPATAQLCLYAAEQGLLPDGSSANSELKVAALKALLPVGKQLAEEAQAAVLEALGSCTLQERTALGFVEAVDARDGTPLTSSWSPTAQLLKSPRASESETLCVLNLRTADIHVNWVDCAGDELHYERERVKSHVRGRQRGWALILPAFDPDTLACLLACLRPSDPPWRHADLEILCVPHVARLRHVLPRLAHVAGRLRGGRPRPAVRVRLRLRHSAAGRIAAVEERCEGARQRDPAGGGGVTPAPSHRRRRRYVSNWIESSSRVSCMRVSLRACHIGSCDRRPLGMR